MGNMNTHALHASPTQFRDAMARLAGAVAIITTDGPGGRAGFTASAVCSLSDDPPSLLVCIKRSSSAFPAFEVNEALCVNLLAAPQQPLAARFGGKTLMQERFADGRWQAGVSGAPALDGAAASIDCRIAQRWSASTHEVLVCEVVTVGLADVAQTLVYFDRGYHALTLEARP
jgi:flavin reductase